MILTIDIGNSTVGAYIFDLDKFEVVQYIKMPTEKFWSISEYLNLMDDSDISKYTYEGAAVSSVVPVLTDVLAEAVKKMTGKDPLILSYKSKMPITLKVDDPSKVGTDRLVDATWAAAEYPLPAMTVDMGTATTINVIDDEKNFLGGFIAPGVATSLHALVENASQLPKVPLKAPEHMIGKNPVECMESGALVGQAAMIDGIAARVEKMLGKPVTLLMTGGLSGLIEGMVEHEHVYDPDLLTKGMAYMYRENQ